MRKAFGWICYAVGGAAAVCALQLIISCELLSVVNSGENLRYEFWDFIFVSSGQHKAYPNGYMIHALRDLFILGWAVLIIGFGREQFTLKEKTRTDTVTLVTCPECEKKTYADAYCRFCGFNLVTHTHQPSFEEPAALSIWKLSLLAYSSVSVLLLILNLLILRTR